MDWKLTNVSKDEYYQMLSMIAIKNDCETLKALTPFISHPIIILGAIPYYALFCNAINDYLLPLGLKHDIFDGSPISVTDVRCKIKLFIDKYASSQKQILAVDDIQNSIYSCRNRSDNHGNFQSSNNLGVFIDKDKHIIINTQYIFYMLQDKRFSKNNLGGNQVRKFGKVLGTIVNSMCVGLSAFMPELSHMFTKIDCTIYFKDYNTNLDFLENSRYDKELKLRILHILCSLNYIRYVLNMIIPKENTWLLRSKYITLYYAIKSIEIITEKMQEGPIVPTSIDKCALIDSKFRSCMMHYELKNHGEYLILDKFLDLETPFFGLVESRFNGLSYNDFHDVVDKIIDELSNHLSRTINLDLSSFKPI